MIVYGGRPVVNRSRSMFCLVVLGVAIASVVEREQSNCDEVREGEVITVRAQDIPKSVQILGTFENPLGCLLTIRGQWLKPGPEVKDRSFTLHVNIVDGQELAEAIKLRAGQVRPVLSRSLGDGPAPGITWDWKVAFDGTQQFPKPSEGETWEILGVESGCFESYSDEAWKEIGIVEQVSPSKSGFYTRFECIAIRKVK